MSEREIPFTQYLLPDGRPRQTGVVRPEEIAVMADALIAAGNRFECEVLTTGDVSLTVTNDDDGDWEIEVCKNGPGVVFDAVDRLITRAARATRRAG